jgi:RNA polymerase sigma factor (sigma-70 family)
MKKRAKQTEKLPIMATAHQGTLLRHLHTLAASQARQRTNGQLLDDFANRRDEAAFTILVARHGPMVLRVCRRVLNHEQDAEDAFQATFLVLARNSRSVRKPEALAAWLRGVAFRTAMKAKRGAARRRTHEAHLKSLPPKPATSPSWDDVQAVLDEEIQFLPESFRMAFALCVLEGKSVPEAAACLEVKPGTVSSRLTRARQRLQRQLARRGIQLTAMLAALSVAEGIGRASVPAFLSHSTIRLALSVEVIPSHIAALAAGVTRAMFLTKIKIATAVLLAAGIIAGAGAGMHFQLTAAGSDAPSAAEKPTPPERPATAAKDKETVNLSGRVLDPVGKPVAGAKLYQAFSVEFIEHNAPPPPRLRGTSDSDGRFHFPVSKEDLDRNAESALQVIAVSDGFGPGWVRLDKARIGELTVRLAKDDVPITGRIRDLEGRPVHGATIRPVALATTPDEDLTPWLQSIRNGKRFQNREKLSKRLTGFPQGIPGLPRTITTDADGRFRLRDVGRERMLLFTIGGPKLAAEMVLVITRPVPKFQTYDNPTTNDKLTIYGASFEHIGVPAKPVTGIVRDKDTGKPIAGVTIDVDGLLVRPTTDKEGKFRLDSFPGGFLDGTDFGFPVMAIPPLDQPYLVGFQEVKPRLGLEALTLDFKLKRGVWVEGRVTDKVTGKPVRAHIEYRPSGDNPRQKDAANFERFPSLPGELYSTRADGSFRVAALPGPGTITARGPYGEYVGDGNAPVNPRPDGEPVRCQIVLDPGRTVTGTIVGPDGEPLDGVRVFNLKTAHFWTPRPLETAAFRLSALDQGGSRSLVFLHLDKRLVKALELQGNAQDPLVVRLEPAGAVTGRLVDEYGQPRPGVNLLIHFVRKDKGYVAEHLLHRIKTDAEGRFRVEGLAPGVVYQINLSGKPPNTTIGSVVPRLSIQSGETKNLGDVKGKLFEE